MDALFDDLIPKQVYGPGAAESGQQATPQQQSYAAAAAKARDATAPAGTVANPSYDTTTAQGDPSTYHVTPTGQLSDPNPQVSMGMFDDLLPGGPVHARTNEVLGLEKGLAEPVRNLWDRIAASPTLTQVADTMGDAFPELDAIRRTTDPLSRRAMDDVNTKIAAGALPGKGGEFVGNTADALTLPGGPLVNGALTGALMSRAPDMQGVGIDALKGAIGGKIGSKIIGGLSGVISPSVSPQVQTLLDAGIPMTAGQITGGALRRVEDAATSIPMAGDVIGNAKLRSLKGLNIAVANRALAPIGETVPTGVEAGRASIAHAGDTLSERYNQILPTLTIQPDAQFGQDLQNLGQQAMTALPGEHAKQLGRLIKDSIIDKIDPATGQMSPKAMQDAESTLNLRISRYSKSPEPANQDMADALTTTQTMLRDLVARNNPQAAPVLGALREGWANLVIGENATKSLGAHEGLFTPAQLAGAVRKSDDTVRNRGYARGTALMQDLSDAALSRLPSSVPDSGSPLRHAVEGAVALGVGKESGMPIVGHAAVGGAVLSWPYTEQGQKFTQAMLAGSRPAIAPHIAALLSQLKPIGRSAAAVGLPTLTRSSGQYPE